MGIEFIDTHSHLYLEEYQGEVEGYLERSAAAGVSRIYLPSLNREHLPAMRGLVDRYPDRCYAMAGIHPCYVKEDYQEQLSEMDRVLTEGGFVAVGEIGLDYYWSRDFDEQQREAFIQQLAMAGKYQLPIVIHSRNSMEATLEVLQEFGQGLKGIFHCFSGTLEQAQAVMKGGLLLGIGGVVTFKKAGLAEVVSELPLEAIVLETDAPFLAPVPFRGKRNESAYLTYIAEKIAEVKGISVEEVARITTANALNIFQRQP